MRPRSIFLLSILSSSQSVLASCARGTTLHRRQVGGAIDLPDFDYGPARGPLNWHEINTENSLCATGRNQSPINIDSTIALEYHGFVNMQIPIQNNVPFENFGTTVEVALSGSADIEGETYALKQFHFHTPGEHQIFGEQYPVEMHMVLEAPGNPGKIAVVGLMLKLVSGTRQTELDELISQVSAIPMPGNTTQIPKLDLTSMVRYLKNIKYFKYQGSLTTPPCTEGITFLLGAEPWPLQLVVYNVLKDVEDSNSRHIQGPLGEENVIVTAANSLAALQEGSPQVANQEPS